MQVTPLGDCALLLRFDEEPDSALALSRVQEALSQIQAAKIPGVIELAPAYNTIAVFLATPSHPLAGSESEEGFAALTDRLRSVLSASELPRVSAPLSKLIEVPVCYDGAFALDLAEIEAHTSLAPAEIVRRHTQAEYRVGCIGFAPGFPYLIGLPRELHTPRRPQPRVEVPAGSVAIGGAQTGVYPRATPGGWNVIGRTPLRLFDLERESPSLLALGDTVRFRAIDRDEFDARAA